MLYKVKIRQLRCFNALMATKNVTRAGELLGLSQPTVSRQLAQLEEAVDFKLFDRFGSSGLVPTRLGEQFYREIEGTLLGMEDIPSIAYGVKEGKGGRLKIAATTPLLNSDIMIITLKRFCAEFPRVDLRVEFVRRDVIESLVAGRQVDIALAALPSTHPNISFEEVINTSAVAVLPRDHPTQHPAYATADDIEAEELILDRGRPLLPQETNFGGTWPQTQNYRIDAQLSLTAIRLVAAGHGATICDPLTALWHESPNVKILPWRPRMELSYGYAIEKSRQITPEEAAFIEVLKRTAREWSAENLAFLEE